MNIANPKDGEYTTYENGVKYVFNVKDKMRDGLCTSYHPNN